MDVTEPRPTVEAGKTTGSLIGAGVAIGLGTVILASLAIAGEWGVDFSAMLDRPDLIVISLAFSAALGWRLGARATNGNRRQTALTGVGFGVFWPPVALSAYAVAAIVDSMLRGVFQPPDIQLALIYLLYGLAILWIYGVVVSIPTGVVWAFASRAVRRVSTRAPGRLESVGRRASTVTFLVSLLVISGLGGVAMTVRYVPWATRCLDLPGGSPAGASFSPAGDLLAVAAHPESTTAGTVILLEWPSGRLLGQWSARVDRAVAVAPDGQVYWSSVDDTSGTNGIMSARVGTQPIWFSAPYSGGMTDLSWTNAGLRGRGTTTDQVGSLPLVGDHSTVSYDESSYVGAVWVSPDGRGSAISTFGPDEMVEVTTPSGTALVVTGPVQSIALTADYHELVAAQANDGLNIIEIASGRSHQLMPGSQAFVTVSQRGDIAWANEEPFGHRHLCTSTLAQLGG